MSDFETWMFVDHTEDQEVVTREPPEYETLDMWDLRLLCRNRLLSGLGLKHELVERLQEYDAMLAEQEALRVSALTARDAAFEALEQEEAARIKAEAAAAAVAAALKSAKDAQKKAQELREKADNARSQAAAAKLKAAPRHIVIVPDYALIVRQTEERILFPRTIDRATGYSEKLGPKLAAMKIMAKYHHQRLDNSPFPKPKKVNTSRCTIVYKKVAKKSTKEEAAVNNGD
ncbi:hypothetical protein RUND412_006408 [Rhizina undulata]